MKINACVKVIIEAAYEWRSAEVHAAACQLGIREDKTGCADEVREEKLTQLIILLDRHKTSVDCCLTKHNAVVDL